MTLLEDFEHSQAIAEEAPAESIELLEKIVAYDATAEDDIKTKEQAVNKLGEMYRKQGQADKIASLSKSIRPFFASIPKAKTAKIVRFLLEQLAEIPNTQDLQVEMCLESIEWCKKEKRMFLRQRIETRLGGLYHERKEYQKAFDILEVLLREVKRLDDKPLLVELHLLESQVHHTLRNLMKTRASLTSARTAAASIYCPPHLQALLDMGSGALHADEKDYKTAYSYFFEAFENYHSISDKKQIRPLKYMFLCKIMADQTQDAFAVLSKHELSLGLHKEAQRDLDAMRAVAKAHQNRSLLEFEETLELDEDPTIHHHLSALYDAMLQQNLLRIIEPFSRVEISHVASLIKLPEDKVEAKLSQMILDKKFYGTLDQGAGALIVFDERTLDKLYPTALDTIKSLGQVVDSISTSADTLS